VSPADRERVYEEFVADLRQIANAPDSAAAR